jgi:hypothetical protein
MKKLIETHRLSLDSTTAPTSVIWTLSSDWAHAKILAQSNSDLEERLAAPQTDSKDLQFEVHYQSGDQLSYVGFSRPLLKYLGLQRLVEQLSNYIQNSTTLNDVVADIVKEKGSALDLSRLMFGVERAWLENPRVDAETDNNLTLAGFLTECERARAVFKSGVGRPIVCEFTDDQGALWLAFVVSRAINGRYLIDLGMAETLARNVLQLA